MSHVWQYVHITRKYKHTVLHDIHAGHAFHCASCTDADISHIRHSPLPDTASRSQSQNDMRPFLCAHARENEPSVQSENWERDRSWNYSNYSAPSQTFDNKHWTRTWQIAVVHCMAREPVSFLSVGGKRHHWVMLCSVMSTRLRLDAVASLWRRTFYSITRDYSIGNRASAGGAKLWRAFAFTALVKSKRDIIQQIVW